MSGYPPSLRVTPGRIRKFLLRTNVGCRKCGYPLLGLPEPRCPECGAWTDLYPRVHAHNLRRIENRIGSLGTIDDYLVQRSANGIAWAHRFSDVKEIQVVRRWGRRTAMWMMVIGLTAMLTSIVFFVRLAIDPGSVSAIGFASSLLLGMGLLGLAVALEPQRWVLLHTTDRSRKIPMPQVGAAEVRIGVARLLKVIEQGWRNPPSMDLDDAAEQVREGYCPRCGYSLSGPPLMVGRPWKGARFAGAMSIAFSIVFLVCSGAVFRASMLGTSDPLPGAAIIGLCAGLFILGIWLTRQSREGPAVPGWTGGGHCPACGWRRSG